MGALQGIGTPASFSAQATQWGNPWGGSLQGMYPHAQFVTSQPPAIPLGSYPGTAGLFAPYPQQQLLQSLQVALLQVLNVVPLQLQQIQQLVQLLAQQPHQAYAHGLQPFQIPSVGPSGWVPGTQTLQPQMFTGQAGYVM